MQALQSYIQNFLSTEHSENTLAEKTPTENNYTYTYDNHCIKVYVPNSEWKENTLTELHKAVRKSIENYYNTHLCKSGIV